MSGSGLLRMCSCYIAYCIPFPTCWYYICNCYYYCNTVTFTRLVYEQLEFYAIMSIQPGVKKLGKPALVWSK